MIRFESVSKRYPDNTVAVDALDLVAPSGQITVFVGPSGSGKTTGTPQPFRQRSCGAGSAT